MFLRHALFYSKRWSRPVTHVYGYSAFERTEMPKSFLFAWRTLPVCTRLVACVYLSIYMDVYDFVSK